MAEPSDPLGVLDLDPKKLELIRKFFESYTGDAALLTKELQAVGRELGFVAEKTTEAAKAEKILQRLYKGRAKVAKDFNEVLNINKQIRDEELKTTQAALVQAEKSFATTKERLALVKEEIENRTELLKKSRIELTQELNILKERHRSGKIKDAEFKKEKKIIGRKRIAQKKYLAGLEDEKSQLILIGREAVKQTKAETKKAKEQEKHNSGIEKSVGFFDKMLEQTGVFSEKWEEGPLGGIMDFQEGGKDITELFDELSLKAGKINFSNLAVNALLMIGEQTLKLMIQFDKLTGDFRKSTGIISKGFGGMEQGVMNVHKANLRMGVSMEEAFGATSALVGNMAAFTGMTKGAQQQVLQATVILQEFGVSATDTAAIFNTFSKGLGYNAAQLEDLAGTIMAVSESLKIPPQIIGQEFAAAMSELGKYGMQATEVFTGLAEQSKATGVAISNLISIAKQFDTFQTAGDAVGRLNALLGGPYLNALEMVYATEEERIQLLRESISLSGQVFQDMSRHEKQAIASAAGISDMGEALKLFGTTDAEFARNSMEMKEMQERAESAQAVQEKFTQAMQAFAISLGPLVDILGVLATSIQFILAPMTFFNTALGPDAVGTINSIWVALVALTLATWKFSGALKAMGVSWLKAMGPIAIGVGVFLALKGLLEIIPDAAKPVAIAIIGIASAIAILRAVLGDMSVLAKFGLAVGAVGALSAAATAGLHGGRETGPGGIYEMAEQGPEGVIPADGSQPYVVENRGTQQLGPGDKVLNEKKTKAAFGSSAAAAEVANSADQLAVLERIATSVVTMADQIATLNSKLGVEEAATKESDQYITMDGEKLAKILGPKIAAKYIRAV